MSKNLLKIWNNVINKVDDDYCIIIVTLEMDIFICNVYRIEEVLFMAALCNRGAIIFLSCSFFMVALCNRADHNIFIL